MVERDNAWPWAGPSFATRLRFFWMSRSRRLMRDCAREMRVELKRLQREGNHTFIYVSHDEQEVLGISDRVAVVEDGGIAQVGTPDDIYDRPRTLYVAMMVGSPPMNILSGQFDAKRQLFISKKFGLEFGVRADGDGLVDAKIGIRPESLTIEFEKSENAIAGEVVGVETLAIRFCCLAMA